MLDLIARLRRSSDLLIECRHCGTAVSQKASHCPVCRGTEFARYELSTA